MAYKHITDHCFSDSLGSTGVERTHVDVLLTKLSLAHRALVKRSNEQAAPLLDIAARKDDLDSIVQLATDIRARFSHVIVAGAGGSGLSGRTLASLKPGIWPSLHFLETIDPDAIDDLVAHVALEKAFVIIVSKSGTTAETLGHFYVLTDLMKKKVGAGKFAPHFLVITMPGDNPLRLAAHDHGIRILNHEANIGGRFSVLTNVGLLPAAIAGLNIAEIRKGAASVVSEMDKAKTPAGCQPALGAALQYAFTEKGRNISVMLPYSERLGGFSSWYRQSWAESLGKNGKGSTPIRAVGTTDQHSQLQLYLDGPKDKLFHLLMLKRAGTGQHFSVSPNKDLVYLQGKTTGDIMAAEQKATLETLIKNKCPVRVFELDTLTEKHIGALVMHFMLEIIFMAELLGVNPFDQPAVEESKRLARDYLLTGKL